MQGYKDPFNRRTYPWNGITGAQRENLTYVRDISKLRIENDCLRTGFYRTLYAQGDVIVFERYLTEGRDFFGKEGKGAQKVVFALNRSAGSIGIRLGESISGITAEVSGPFENAVRGCVIETAGEEVRLNIEPYGISFVKYISKI